MDGKGPNQKNGLSTDVKGDTTMDNKERIEMTDEELEQVVGGFSVGERVKVSSHMICYCPGCGKLQTVAYGTVVATHWYEKGQHYFVDVKADCCGYSIRAIDAACETI